MYIDTMTTVSTFRIQYVSDLHLEMCRKETLFPTLVNPCAKYLALAGDIGQPGNPCWDKFFEYVSKGWERIFYVPGNHEYYNTRPKKEWKYHAPTSLYNRHNEIRQSLNRFPNVILLDSFRASHYLPSENVAIVGSTLWSEIPADKEADVERMINDYNYISIDSDQALRPIDSTKMWRQQRDRINEEIQYWTAKKANIIVLTHHMPSFRLISPRYIAHPANCAFASKCDYMLTPYVHAWIYGHTHDARQTIIRGVQCVINAKGYPEELVLRWTNEASIQCLTTLHPEQSETSSIHPERTVQMQPLPISSSPGSASPECLDWFPTTA